MSNKLQLFNFEGQEVRVVWIDDKKDWRYILTDVCKLLGIANASQAAQRLKADGICQTYIIDALGREQEVLCIDEPNYFRLIFRSDKPNAIAIQDWTYEEVLPAIRKTGSYSISEDINFQGYNNIMHLDLKDNPELLRQAIQLYEDLGLTIRDKRKMLIEIEKESFPGNTFTRGKRKTLDIGLYLRQVSDRFQFGVKIVGEEIVIQRAFWGQDRAV